MKHLFTSFLLGIFAITPLLSPLAASASFDAGFIISDESLFSTNTMSQESIQQFLLSHEGVLKSHIDTDIDGLVKTASMIIYSAAQRHNINPQILLVKLQKEMGLITDSTPKQSQFDWAMGYGVCDNCDVTHPNVLKFKGFSKQVDNAAEFFAYVANSQDKFFYKNGGTYTISGQEVTIQNNVTAALYNYTPHIHGNEIFSSLFKKWFSSPLLSYPDGTLLQAYGQPGVWLIRENQRHAFNNLASLTSRYSIDQIIQVPLSTVESYTKGSSIGFPEFSVLRLPNGNTYLLVNNQLRWIEDETTFRHLGYFEDEVEAVSQGDIDFFSQGLPINMSSLDPIGALVQDPESFGIYYVQDGIKYPLVAPELLSLNFENLKVRKGTEEELAYYEKGPAILLKDGFLVKTRENPSVYVIANGQKHEIDSEETFNSLGYKWNNIRIVSETLLALHPTATILSVHSNDSNLSDQEAQTLVEDDLSL
jgi:hypothetical protein